MMLTEAYRGDTNGRPTAVPLPPARLPLFYGGVLRKQWRYVSVWSDSISVCAGRVAVGPVTQAFWAVWDREAGQLYERTRLFHGQGRVRLEPGRLLVNDGEVAIDLALEEEPGFEVVTPVGQAYTWTRKQCPVRAQGSVRLGGRTRRVEASALIDDNAGYHPRQTLWQWSGGAGVDVGGRPVAWSVIVGLNDAPQNSERTVWVEGQAQEVGPVTFEPDLSAVRFAEGAELRFTAEATRARRDNLLLICSAYRQPFGRFEGTLPGGVEVAQAFGVMEWHRATW